MVTIFAKLLTDLQTVIELLTDLDHIWSPYPLTIYGHYMVTMFAKLLTDIQTVTELITDLALLKICFQF